MSMHAIQHETPTAHMLQLPTDIVAAPMPSAVTATMTATSYSTVTVIATVLPVIVSDIIPIPLIAAIASAGGIGDGLAWIFSGWDAL